MAITVLFGYLLLICDIRNATVVLPNIQSFYIPIHFTSSQFTKLWKESLKSEGHQFHQYQQSEQSSIIPTELTEHKKDHKIWCLKSRS
jgi:hypothetical protein